MPSLAEWPRIPLGTRGLRSTVVARYRASASSGVELPGGRESVSKQERQQRCGRYRGALDSPQCITPMSSLDSRGPAASASTWARAEGAEADSARVLVSM